jgi:DNA repair protein RadC
MATVKSKRNDCRLRRIGAVRRIGTAIRRILAHLSRGMAARHRHRTFQQPVCSRSGAQSLRDWPGNLGLPSVCDDFWRDCSGKTALEEKLFANALGSSGLGGGGRALLDQLGSIPRILLTDQRELVRISGDNALAQQLTAIRVLAMRLLRSDEAKFAIADTHTLIRYLCAEMGHLRIETVRVIFLDGHNRFLHEETMWRGTIDEVNIHSREVMRRAIELDASALILAHNHPSGISKPSPADIALTRDILSAARSLGLTLHDHLIVTTKDALSLRLAGFVKPWD